MHRVLRALATVTVAAGLMASADAFAMGSSSSSTSSQPSDYDKAQKAALAGDYKGAIMLLEQVVGKDPGNADAYNYLGYSHRKLGNDQQALDYYTKALAIDTDHRGANEYLGELHLSKGDLAKAEAQLERARRHLHVGLRGVSGAQGIDRAPQGGQQVQQRLLIRPPPAASIGRRVRGRLGRGPHARFRSRRTVSGSSAARCTTRIASGSRRPRIATSCRSNRDRSTPARSATSSETTSCAVYSLVRASRRLAVFTESPIAVIEVARA